MDWDAMKKEHEAEITRRPLQVHFPGWITDDEVGLGDVIKYATSLIGIQPCDTCARRAAMLNRWMVFSSRRTK